MTQALAATLTGHGRTIPVTVHLAISDRARRGLSGWGGAIEADPDELMAMFFDDDEPLTLTLLNGSTGRIHIDQVNAYGQASFKGDGPPPPQKSAGS